MNQDENEKLNLGQLSSNHHLPAKTKKEKFLAFFLIALLLCIGIFIAISLVKSKTKVKKKQYTSPKATLVTGVLLKRTNAKIVIEAYGEVVPSKEVSITPQVSGRISYINENFIPGAIFKKEDVIAKIDDYDYKVALKQKDAALQAAKAKLKLEMGQQKVAQNDWEMMKTISSNQKIKKEEKELALRVPQLEQAKAELVSAQALFEQAKEDLERTRIKVPFDAVVTEKNIDLGENLSTQSQVAKIVGINSYWIYLAIPTDNLKWIDLNSSSVLLTDASRKDGIQYKAKILKVLSTLEEGSLFAQILISIDDPLGLKSGKPPVFLASYMQAKIIAKELKDVFQIPLSAFDERDRVFTATADNKLKVHKPQIIWKDENFAYIKNSFSENDFLITSKISTPINEMDLEIEKEDNKTD